MTAPHAQDESLRRMSEAPNYNAWLLERARPFLGPRVLDVGAGIGTFTAELARDAEHVLALEPDDYDFAKLAQRFADAPNVEVANVGADALAEREWGGAFDAAICFNVLEHIPDDVGAMRGIRSRLRTGGHLLVIVPAHKLLFGEIDRSVDHVRRYDKAELRERLAATGFEVVELRHVNPVGALGWLVSSRILRREQVPEGPLKLYDRFVPALKLLDRARLPVGLSLWAAARATSAGT